MSHDSQPDQLNVPMAEDYENGSLTLLKDVSLDFGESISPKAPSTSCFPISNMLLPSIKAITTCHCKLTADPAF